MCTQVEADKIPGRSFGYKVVKISFGKVYSLYKDEFIWNKGTNWAVCEGCEGPDGLGEVGSGFFHILPSMKEVDLMLRNESFRRSSLAVIKVTFRRMDARVGINVRCNKMVNGRRSIVCPVVGWDGTFVDMGDK